MRNAPTAKWLIWTLLIANLGFLSVAEAQNAYVVQAGIRPKYDKVQAGTNNPNNQPNQKTLFDVLKELNKKRGVYFLFSNPELGKMPVETTVDLTRDVERILREVLKNAGLTYKKVSPNTYVITDGKEGTKKFSDAHPINMALTLNGAESLSSENRLIVAELISGRITTPSGQPLANASVTVKGTTRGTTTNANGEFSLQADRGEVLVISSVGYATQEVTIEDSNVINISLAVGNQQLSEVVVTALGIQRRAKSLTYSTQKLSGSELSTVKDANVINGLAGKAAGVTINRSASGVGGSARVVLRGNKSTRENQPLYVIDGIPLANFSPGQPTDVWGQSSGSGSGGRDGGDGISNINPDDIESVNILKGASAAALYGSQAANGVILITTKKGRAGQSRIDFSTNFTFETPLLKPELQYTYGQTIPQDFDANVQGTRESWGAKVDAPDHVEDFWQTGTTWTNALSFSGGNQAAQTYFSYSNTDNRGIMPTSEFTRHTLNFRESLKLLNDKLSVDGNFSFVTQKATNRPVSGLYNNPLSGLYIMPRGLDFDYYKNNYEIFSPRRNVKLQNWWNINYDKDPVWGGDDNQQNPYWALYRNKRIDSRNRGYGSLALKYQFTKWLSVQARGNFDKSYDEYELKSNAGTQSVLAGSNGRYTFEAIKNTQLYGDLIATAIKDLSDKIGLTVNLGASILDLKANDRKFFDTDPTEGIGLEFANKFAISNIRAAALVRQEGIQRKQNQSVFGSATLSLNDNLYLDVTGRNDWSSSFSNTPTLGNGYFYWSAGLTAVVSDMVTLPDFWTFAKARISYAKVGNDIPAYLTNPAPNNLVTISGQPQIQINTKRPYPGAYLKPEDNRSLEIGADLRFFQDRLGIDFTWYKNNNYDQYMEIPAGLGSGFEAFYLNLGNIQNTGIEAMVTIVPFTSKNLRWTSSFNMGYNKNKVVELSNADIPGSTDANFFQLTGYGVNMYGSFIKEGGQWGDIYGNVQLVRNEEGAIVVTDDGTPVTENAVGQGVIGQFLGNANPKFLLGWNNSFDFKNFIISFLIDGRFGGDVMSVTQSVLDYNGVSEVSKNARDAGGLLLNAVKEDGSKYSDRIDAQKYYTKVGNRNGVGEVYMYDATNIRLREFAIGYQLPKFAKFVREASISLVGRNLFFFKKEAPFDPDLSMSTGNGLQGIDVFAPPSTRSYGINLKVGF